MQIILLFLGAALTVIWGNIAFDPDQECCSRICEISVTTIVRSSRWNGSLKESL